MKISEALDSIRKRDIVLPEFQREFVWSLEQAKQLLLSLFRGYPVGGLLIWKTDQPPILKNIDKLPEKLGTVQVLLDGQQRMTTLHMLITGEIPAYYTTTDITNDPRDLYFNLETADFQYYQASKMKDDPMWCRVIDCFSNPPKVFQLAQTRTSDPNNIVVLAERLNDHLNRIRAICDLDIPTQSVPSHAPLAEAIDIFDRVNSQGTKLTDAELALTHITGKWPDARRVMKQRIEECAKHRFDFTLTFMTRALTTTVTRRALFEVIHDRTRAELEGGWHRLTKILDYLTTFLPSRAFIHSSDELNTTNALIPLVTYLSVNSGKFPNEPSVKHAINWLYAALMWARYTSQTDQRLEADVSLVVKETNPWDALRAQIVDQRGRIEVQASDFAGRGAQSPFYRATFILAKVHNAVDWFNGLPLANTHGPSYGLHSHHVFPQALLYKGGLDVDDYTHRQLVNEIANRAFLTAETNLTIADRSPDVYLPEVEARFPGALPSQFIPMDPQLWKVEHFRDFLQARRELVALKLNEFMNSLIAEPERPYHRPVGELITLGESYTLEFKSTLQWDIVKGERNMALRMSAIKTIAAFLNSEGGTLVVGVDDDGTILGLAPDLTLLDGSADRFERTLVQLVAEHLGLHVAPFVRVRFESVDSARICVVDVERSPEPIFTKTDKGKEFFVRNGNTTRALDTEEAHRYVEMNWT